MSIRHTSFRHGWFYHYRIHDVKINSLCSNGFSSLGTFMDKMLKDCPDHYFTEGPRSSALRFSVDAEPIEIQGHEVCQLAEVSHDTQHYKTAHSRVQVHMLQNDERTIGVEVPIWIMPYELERFRSIFGSEMPLSGHIDVLRIEDGNVWIWDYKPGASKEKYASTQVYFYALMLSQRTGIALDKFRCGYFDEKVAYVFKPELKILGSIAI